MKKMLMSVARYPKALYQTRGSDFRNYLVTMSATTSLASVEVSIRDRSLQSQTERGGHRGRGRGRGGPGLSASLDTADAPPNSSATTVNRGHWGWRGRGRGRGRGGGGSGSERNMPRPTHFLALPLQHHSTLRTRVANFQSALLEHAPPITGLDNTIVIDPRRLHLTLGVMALETGDSPGSGEPQETQPARTVETALDLLRSLKPRISELLSENGGGSRLKVPLELLDVFPPGATTGANVLYLGPDMTGIDDGDRPGPLRTSFPTGSTDEKYHWKQRLWKVSDFIHQEFKKAGYITERRPLKLHCTILNTSHRKPHRRIPFSYDDILSSNACNLIATSRSEQMGPGQSQNKAEEGSINSQIESAELNPGRSRRGSSALPVTVGVYDVNDVQLWVMGSRGPNNEYVSLGGIRLE
ncbi:hypothetical protein CC2G_013422 [Coprinopsis cinerea AmutBmut pab1-1]|nr:hypothetical protein CC2G_013422 [Coprinopsis cinerea AmutBmut pab1-1]